MAIQTYLIKLKQIIQPRKHQRNRAALKMLCALGFEMPAIRNGLLTVNGIKAKDLVNGHEISTPSIYNTLSGKRDHELVKKLVAERLGLHVSELWP